MEDIAQPCAVTFWTFAVPVITGNAAMLAMDGLTALYYHDKPKATRETASNFAKFGVFWLAAGVTWIAMNHKNGAQT